MKETMQNENENETSDATPCHGYQSNFEYDVYSSGNEK